MEKNFLCKGYEEWRHRRVWNTHRRWEHSRAEVDGHEGVRLTLNFLVHGLNFTLKAEGETPGFKISIRAGGAPRKESSGECGGLIGGGTTGRYLNHFL